MDIKLPKWQFDNLRNPLKLVDPSDYSECYWLGAVQLDSDEFKEFINNVKTGNLKCVTSFSKFGGDLAYAVLCKLKDKKDRFHIIVIDSPVAPDKPESCMLLKEITDVSVTPIDLDKIENEYLGDDNRKYYIFSVNILLPVFSLFLLLIVFNIYVHYIPINASSIYWFYWGPILLFDMTGFLDNFLVSKLFGRFLYIFYSMLPIGIGIFIINKNKNSFIKLLLCTFIIFYWFIFGFWHWNMMQI